MLSFIFHYKRNKKASKRREKIDDEKRMREWQQWGINKKPSIASVHYSSGFSWVRERNASHTHWLLHSIFWESERESRRERGRIWASLIAAPSVTRQVIARFRDFSVAIHFLFFSSSIATIPEYVWCFKSKTFSSLPSQKPKKRILKTAIFGPIGFFRLFPLGREKEKEK